MARPSGVLLGVRIARILDLDGVPETAGRFLFACICGGFCGTIRRVRGVDILDIRSDGWSLIW
jgi:hypothetical protein